MMVKSLNERLLSSYLVGVILLLSVPGCVATRGWVHEQMTPMAERVSEVEARVEQSETQLIQLSWES